MGNTRSWTTSFNTRTRELEGALKVGGYRSQAKRRDLISRAASGRPDDLASKAKAAVAERRVARDLETIAGVRK